MKKSDLQLINMQNLNSISGGKKGRCSCMGPFHSVGIVDNIGVCSNTCCTRLKTAGYLYGDTAINAQPHACHLASEFAEVMYQFNDLAKQMFGINPNPSDQNPDIK